MLFFISSKKSRALQKQKNIDFRAVHVPKNCNNNFDSNQKSIKCIHIQLFLFTFIFKNSKYAKYICQYRLFPFIYLFFFGFALVWFFFFTNRSNNNKEFVIIYSSLKKKVIHKHLKCALIKYTCFLFKSAFEKTFKMYIF